MILFTSGQRVGTTLLHESLLQVDGRLASNLIHFHFYARQLEWFWEQQDRLTHLIVLRRKNKIRQAISLLKVQHSQIYHCRTQEQLDRHKAVKFYYDFNDLQDAIKHIGDAEERITALLETWTLPRLNVYYEDIESPEKLVVTMRNIFKFIERDVIVPDVFETPTYKTGDATSEEYYQQFLKDFRSDPQCNSKDLDALIGA